VHDILKISRRKFDVVAIKIDFGKGDIFQIDRTQIDNQYWGEYDMAVSVVAENRVYVQCPQDALARNDWKETGDLQFGYALSPEMRLYVDGGVTGNQSNMNSGTANYSYTQGTLVVGLSSHFGL
jgi:predicted porin